jgi:hypothetical protein
MVGRMWYRGSAEADLRSTWTLRSQSEPRGVSTSVCSRTDCRRNQSGEGIRRDHPFYAPAGPDRFHSRGRSIRPAEDAIRVNSDELDADQVLAQVKRWSVCRQDDDCVVT